jgi:hypothetical protein
MQQPNGKNQVQSEKIRKSQLNRNQSGKIGTNQKKSVLMDSQSGKIGKIGGNRENRNKSEKVRFTGVRHQIQPDSTTTAWNLKKSEKIGKNQFRSPANRKKSGKIRINQNKSEKIRKNREKSGNISFPNNGNQWIPLDSSDRNRIRKNQKKSEKIRKIGINQKKSEKVSFEGNQ